MLITATPRKFSATPSRAIRAVERRRLGAIVFADRQAMDRLNALTHPPLVALIRRKLDQLAGAGQHDLAVLEAAVYFILPGPPPVDLTITVTAPSESRLARLIATGIEPARALGRISAQSHLEPTWERSDRTIVNDRLGLHQVIPTR